jgi:hypothetical protein
MPSPIGRRVLMKSGSEPHLNQLVRDGGIPRVDTANPAEMVSPVNSVVLRPSMSYPNAFQELASEQRVNKREYRHTSTRFQLAGAW